MSRIATWNNIGKDVSEYRDYRSVLTNAGLDYEVVMKPGRIRVDGREIRTGDYYTMRKGDPEHIYGRVSREYNIIQNETAFAFADYISEDLAFVRAGETALRKNPRTGRISGGMVYMIGKLPPVTILGDSFTPHIIMSNDFAGQMAMRVALCFLRLVCLNQFNWAYRNSRASLSFIHNSKATAALEEGRFLMKSYADSLEGFNKTAEGYACMKLSPRQIRMALDAMFRVTGNESPEVLARIEREKQRFMEAFAIAYAAPDNANFTGTAWGLINAYMDVITHQEKLKKTKNWEENRFIEVTFGNHTNRLMSAIDIVAA